MDRRMIAWSTKSKTRKGERQTSICCLSSSSVAACHRSSCLVQRFQGLQWFSCCLFHVLYWFTGVLGNSVVCIWFVLLVMNLVCSLHFSTALHRQSSSQTDWCSAASQIFLGILCRTALNSTCLSHAASPDRVQCSHISVQCGDKLLCRVLSVFKARGPKSGCHPMGVLMICHELQCHQVVFLWQDILSPIAIHKKM